jgi:hypothetical protein
VLFHFPCRAVNVNTPSSQEAGYLPAAPLFTALFGGTAMTVALRNFAPSANPVWAVWWNGSKPIVSAPSHWSMDGLIA